VEVATYVQFAIAEGHKRSPRPSPLSRNHGEGDLLASTQVGSCGVSEIDRVTADHEGIRLVGRFGPADELVPSTHGAVQHGVHAERGGVRLAPGENSPHIAVRNRVHDDGTSLCGILLDAYHGAEDAGRVDVELGRRGSRHRGAGEVRVIRVGGIVYVSRHDNVLASI